MSQEPSEPFTVTSEQKYEILEALDHLQHLEGIDQSLKLLAEAAQSTTAQPPSSEQPKVLPPAEIAAEANPERVVLPDGREVPTAVIQALHEYDASVWPGALLPEARASVASAVLRAAKGAEVAVLRTNYPFCLDDPEAVKNDSPCIKRADHPGKHQDNNDGTW
jgi:hypothetical protein